MGIYNELRKAIQTSSKSRYRLWKETGINEGHLARFMADSRGLSVENIEKLCDALGIEIIIQSKGTEKGKAKRGKHNK